MRFVILNACSVARKIFVFRVKIPQQLLAMGHVYVNYNFSFLILDFVKDVKKVVKFVKMKLFAKLASIVWQLLKTSTVFALQSTSSMILASARDAVLNAKNA